MHSHNLETQDLKTLKVLSKAHCFPAHLDFESKKGCIKPGVTQTTKSIRGWRVQQDSEMQKSFTAAPRVDPAEILRFLLRKMQVRHGEKYGELLADDGLA